MCEKVCENFVADEIREILATVWFRTVQSKRCFVWARNFVLTARGDLDLCSFRTGFEGKYLHLGENV